MNASGSCARDWCEPAAKIFKRSYWNWPMLSISGIARKPETTRMEEEPQKQARTSAAVDYLEGMRKRRSLVHGLGIDTGHAQRKNAATVPVSFQQRADDFQEK